MNGKLDNVLALSFISILILSILSVTRIQITSVYALPGTRIFLDPQNYKFVQPTNGSLGERFNVTVKVEDVTDLASYQVCIVYNDTIINITRWYEPTWDPKYVFKGKTTLAVPFPPDVGYEHIGPGNGSGRVGSALFPPPPMQSSFTGSGTLCILEFEITADAPEGETYSCALYIDIGLPYNTFLLDSVGGEIPATKENGYYELSGGVPPLPEPPVANFTWSPIKPLENETVTFDASASTPNGGFIVNYTWNFGDGTPLVNETDPTATHKYTTAGTYTVTLNVTDSQGLWDTESKSITVRPPRRTDVNGDGRVDWLDIFIVIMAFGSRPGHPRWNPDADVDGDDRIDMRDIFFILLDWGRT